MSLLRQGKAEVLTIYLGEADRWQGTSAYVALVQLFRASGCAGATVTRAVAGYGAGHRLHHDHVWQLSSDAPVIVQVVDQPERLHRLLPQIQEMVPGGLITLHETTVFKYTHARRQGLPTKLPVRQIMETAITVVTPETPVARVADILLEASFRVLPVVDAQRHLLGIIGTRDLIDAGILPVRRGVVRAVRNLGDQGSTGCRILAGTGQAAAPTGRGHHEPADPRHRARANRAGGRADHAGNRFA